MAADLLSADSTWQHQCYCLLLLLLLLQGLYSASAGTHPGGSVVGCAGHNAAGCVVKDMGLQPWWPTA